jgi:hypothetical protein
MKINYSKLHENSTLVISVLKAYHSFLIVIIALFICDNSFAQTISSFTPPNACNGSGTLVTINGTGFTGTLLVKFNGISSSFIEDSDTQIRATLPLNATTGQIEVTTVSGFDTSSIFTVNTLSVAPTSITGTTTVCNGNSTTLTLNGGTLGTGAVAEWFSGSCNGTPLETGNSITVSPIGNTTYYVRYNGTCNTTACTSITVIVNPVPVPSVTIGVNPSNNICAGNSVTFTAAPNNGGSAPSYQWKINGVNSGTDSYLFNSSSLINTDIVTVVLTSNATCASPINATSNQIKMTVNDILTPSVSISSSTTTICPGNSVNFSATPINGGSNPNYQWKVNNLNVGTDSATYSTTSLNDGDIVTVELTSNAICVSPTKTTSNSITITVNPAIPTTPLSISGIATQCPSLNNQTYSIAAVTNATIYNWTVPSGWTITGGQGTTSINVTTGNSGQNGNISVTAGNSCGTSAVSTLAVTVSPAAPATPGVITGTVTQCPALNGQIYSIVAVPNATTYNWTIPTGWSITAGAGTNSITVTSGSTGQNGNISVTAENSCGTNVPRTLAVTVEPETPGTPGAISGTVTQCPALIGQIYSVDEVTNATTYTWTVPTGWSINTGAGTNLITVTSGNAAQNGTISVTAGNSCGTSSARTLAVIVSPATPLTPATITGTSAVCPGITGLTYSVVAVTNATTYNWTIPTGWSITAGTGTNSITVTSGSAVQNGNISVTVGNSCGTSSARTLAVTVNPGTPATPTTITGTITQCPALTGRIYSIAAITNATTYTWTVPTGWSITAGAGTNSITITTGSPGQNGNISVSSGNSCGTSTANSLAVAVSPAIPTTPGPITGTSPVCPSTTGLTYSIVAVANATNYDWNVPIGWTITSGSGTNTITVTTGSPGQNGNISVSAGNSCGTSLTSTLNVNISPNASIASVTGTSNLCISTPTTFTSNSVILGGGTGAWSSSNNSVATVNTSGIVTATAAGTCDIIYTITGGCGGNVSASQAVNVFSGIPTTPIIPITPAGQSSSLCPIAYGLIYSISAVANATSYTWNVPAGWTITSGQGTTAIVVDAGVQSTGTKNISVTATNACGSSTSPNYSATVGTFGYVDAGVDQVVCAGTSTVSLLATGGGSTNINNDLTWSAPSGSFSNTGKANATYTINNAIATNGGSVTLTATVRAEGSCPVSTDQLIITVLPPVTASISGTTTICSGSTTNITFNATPNTTVNYTVTGIAGSSTINIGASGTAVSTTPALSSSRTYTLTSVAYTATPNCSLSASGSAIVTVSQTPIVNAGGPDTVCQSNTPIAITLSGATRSGGATAAAWSITSGGGSLSSTAPTPNPASVTYTPAANYSGNVILTLTSDVPTACSPTSATRTITVNASPTVNAGGPDIVCQSATPSALTLSGATIGAGATTAAWSITSGGGTLSSTAQTASPATVTYTAAANSSGVITLTLTTNALSACSPISAARTITVNAASSVNAGTNQTICQSATPSRITLAGASVGGGATTGAWSITSGGGTLSNTAQTASPATVTYTPAANYSGAVILTLTTNALSTCSSVSATKTITVNALSTVNPGLDQTICQSATYAAITLAGSSVGGGATTGAWSITSGGGTLSNTAQTATPSSVTYTPATNYSGNVILTLTTNSATSCNPTTATRTITVNVPSTVNPGLNLTNCQSPSPSAIPLTGASFGGGATTAAWSITSGGGSLSNTAQTTTPDLVTYTPAANYNGNVILTLTTNSLSSCTAISATRIITVNAAPTVNAGGPNFVCQSISPSSITLTGASISDGETTAAWSITSGGGTLSSTAQTTSPATINYTPASNYSGNITLTLTTNALTSCSPITDTRTIKVNAASTVDAGSDQTICQSASPSAIILTGSSVGGGATTAAWSITSGGGTLSSTAQTASPATITYTPASNYSGTIILELTTNSATSCSTASATKTLTVKKEIIITTQPSNTSICASFSANLYVVAIGDELTYQWYKGAFPGVAVSNTANISGAQSSNLHFNQASLTDDGIYYVTVSGASACSIVTSAQRTLNVDQAIIVSTQPLSQSVCEDTANVNFSVTANAGGDPLTYQWRKNGVNIVGATAPTFTIPTATLTTAGNYDVVISGPSGYTCSSIQSATAILTVKPKPIGSAIAKTVCSGSPTNVLLNSTIAGTTFSWIAAIQATPTGGTITGFSDSSGNIIAQSLTNTGISAGTIRYTITPTANSCIGITFTVDVTVNPAPVGSAIAQTICSGSTTNVVLNSTVTGTTYSWTAAIQTSPTAGTITGFSNGTQNTIVQTLNNTGTTAGIIRYTVTPTADSCTGTAFTVDVTINPNSTIVLSSVSGSDNPTNCVNTILNISYAIGGGGTNASITAGALPAGITGSYNTGTRVFTISGNPTAVGIFNYTVTTQGLCSNASVSGSITVNPDSTITLNLGTGSDSQTKCINSVITPIKYTISNGGTNPSIAWNPGPANLIGAYDSAAGVYTISGSSAIAGIFNYTITTAGSCINSSLTGQITVNPNPVGSANAQTICSGSTTSVALNSNVSGTTFTWTAAIQSTPTGGTITGSGNSSGSSIAQTLTNTGTTSGSIRYTVTPTANSCPGSAFTVDVIVNPKPNGSAIAQTVCSGLPTNVALNSTVSGTTFTWTSAIFSMPTGGTISGFNTGTTNTIAETLSNSGTAAGVIRYNVTPTTNNCPGTVFTVDITVNAPTVGGTTTITSTTNPSNVDNGTNKLTDCHSSGGVIRLNGNVGTVVRWETSTNAGGTWIPRGNAGSLTYNYTGITTATIFRAVIQNSSCTIVNSGTSILFIIPNIKPSPVSAIPSTICEGESTQLTSDSGFSSSQNLASGGLFNTANPAGWLVDDKIFPASGDNGVNNEFSETNGNAGDEYDSGDGKFAITRGNRTSVMQTPVFDLIGLTSANLTFDHAYKLDAVNDYAEVKISLDGGLTYAVTLATFNGNTSIKNPFKNSNPANSISLNLNTYLGYSNIKIGFFFYGTVNAAGSKIPNLGSTWAIDNVKIPQAPNPLLTSQWKNLNTDAIISVTNTTRVTVTPPVTTTYEVTSFLNGCTSYGEEGTTYVTVTVNKRPTANIGPDQTICYDGTATFSVTLTGVAPWTITYTNGTTPTTVTGINTSPYIFNVPNIKADVTYTITALNDKNCTPFPGGITGSAKVKVLLGRAGWWTGLVSTDWFDCKNWEQGLPSFTIDANILPTIANGNRLPIIDKTSPYAIPYSGIASAKDMIINTNGSVTMVSTNNSELQISGNWRNSGAFIPGTGTVTFNGATVNQVQTVNLGIKTNETFFNLTTNNTGGAKGISVVDKFELTVLNYVTLLSGDVRLTGEAQLVQAGIAANPTGGAGKLLIDQQGQKNSYNYNYWSSPVSTNNLSYSIGGVLRDGTDVTTNPFNPSSISFGDGAYFADTQNIGAIKISNRWLWSYNSLTPATNTDWQNYYQWNYIGKSGTIKIGEGYSMKGTGGKALISAIQNYVFVGKPNSGDIALAIKPQQSYLIGNPYPSALDANLFIRNNLAGCVGCTGTANVFNGALYFWDHFALSNNHLLAQYEGGYSIYTLIGGLIAIADTPLTANNNAKGTKEPLQYIPVAQGFFVQAFINSALTTTTNIQQGYLSFKNTQRVFNRESDGNSLFMKAKGSKQVDSRLADVDMRPKIKFNFITAKGINRQLLVGADPNTTNQFDIGYDAPILETKGDSFYWEFSNSKFVIQGVPNFDNDQIIPFGIKVANEGVITLKISLLENIPASTEIYLYDNMTNLYSEIKNNDFQIALGVGEYNKRFSLQFVNKTLSVDTSNLENGILIYYSNTNQTLNIQNNFIDAEVSTVDLYNLTGQKIAHWAIDEVKQNNIIIPITDLSTAGYIVKVKTTKGDLSKKIIIK